MKCVTSGLNIKVLARAIHSLARVGDELYIEPSNAGVHLRTVNASRSAFGSYFFKSSFFLLFDFKVQDVNQQNNFKCKVSLKACLNAFKSINNIERSVEKCRISINPEEDRLVIVMSCRHGISKTYNLTFIDCEVLQAVFDKESSHFSITCQSRVLADALMNFQSNQEEITLISSPEKTFIRNYIDDDPDPAKSIHTELVLEADEFDSYLVDKSCDVTFCLKEIRALLSFSEPLNLPVCFVFTEPGSPIIFSVENSSVFEVNFVLATLSSAVEPNQAHTSTAAATSQTIMSKESRDLERHSESIFNSDKPKNRPQQSSEYIFASPINSEHQKKLSSSSVTRRLPSSGLNGIEKKASFERQSLISPGEYLRTDNVNDKGNKREVLFDTPPSKRRRFFFKRCFNPTYDANEFNEFKKVLAEDSDDDC